MSRTYLVHCGLQLSVRDTASVAATGFCNLHMKRYVQFVEQQVKSRNSMPM